MMMKYLVLVLYDDDESLPRVGVALDALEHDILISKKKKKNKETIIPQKLLCRVRSIIHKYYTYVNNLNIYRYIVVMAKIYELPVFECQCGYYTTVKTNAMKHSKTLACKDKIMSTHSKEFVLREEYDKLAAVSIVQTGQGTALHTNNGNLTVQNIQIHLHVPDKSVVSSVYDAVKNTDCVNELRGADPSEIPAILFKYTRGKMAERQYITYDPDKNVVKHIDPVTKREVAQDLKKYRNEYLVDSSEVFDDTYHLPYLPPRAQVPLKDLTKPAFETGKKKDEPISGAEVVKMCAAGDHRMYKLPHGSKKFYTDVAKNVDIEIKSTV